MPVSASKAYYNLDKNGNLISGDGYFREYNGFNQLKQVYRGDNAGGELLVSYTWDPIEERVLAKEEYESGVVNQLILYLDKHQIMIKNSSGQFYETYVYQDDVLVGIVDTDGNKFAVHTDLLGSADVITDANGEVVEKRFYSPFGEELGKYEKSMFGYEGKEFDRDTKDTDFHFRKYRADMARFTQPDTLIPNVYDPQQLNRYAFERGNPVKHVDENGRWATQVGGEISGGIIPFSGSAGTGIAFSYDELEGLEFGVYGDLTGAYVAGGGATGMINLNFDPNARKISDLEETSKNYGFTGAYGLGAGITIPEEAMSADSGRQGFGLKAGVGYALEGQYGETSTQTLTFLSLGKQLDKSSSGRSCKNCAVVKRTNVNKYLKKYNEQLRNEINDHLMEKIRKNRET